MREKACERSPALAKHSRMRTRSTKFVERCDAIVHLAGMNRGEETEIYTTNVSLGRQTGCGGEQRVSHPLQIVFASSTQRDLDNPYGRSKKYGEMQFAAWAQRGLHRQAEQLDYSECFRPRLQAVL